MFNEQSRRKKNKNIEGKKRKPSRRKKNVLTIIIEMTLLQIVIIVCNTNNERVFCEGPSWGIPFHSSLRPVQSVRDLPCLLPAKEHLDSLKQWHYFFILSVTLSSKLPLLFNTLLGHLDPEGIIIILSLFVVYGYVHMCTWACVCFPFITLVSHLPCPAWWRAELREDSTTWPWLFVCFLLEMLHILQVD